MRVIHLIKTGHGAHWAHRQIQVLIKEGIDVHVIIGEDGPMIDRFKSIGAKVHRLDIDIAKIKIWNLPNTIFKFRNLIKEIKPDLIHSHFVGTTLFMRIALFKMSTLPRIFQVAGPLHLEKILPRWVEIKTAGKQDFWISTCKLTNSLYLKYGVSSNRLYLSYYGTEVEKITLPGKRCETRAQLNLSATTFAIGMVAYMYPPRKWIGQKTGLKGHEDLIDALKILIDQGYNVKGIFVGGAWGNAKWYENKIHKYSHDRIGDNAIFLGNRNDVPALYECIDIAVHPSHSENVGGAAESLLLGVPSIATSVGGFPDVIIDGKTGYLSPPKDPRELATCIAKMIHNIEHAKEMAALGQSHCGMLFDINRTGKQIAEIYRLIASQYPNKYF